VDLTLVGGMRLDPGVRREATTGVYDRISS
jgi:hypothetical protein